MKMENKWPLIMRGALMQLTKRPWIVVYCYDDIYKEKKLFEIAIPNETEKTERAFSDCIVFALKEQGDSIPCALRVLIDDEIHSFMIAPTMDLFKNCSDERKWEREVCPALASRADVVRDKIAVVTGGAQGFGEEIVRGLVKEGAIVFIADLNEDGAKNLAEQLNDEQKRVVAFGIKVNVSDENSVIEMFDEIVKQVGGIDLCVSNAGVLRASSILEQDIKSFQFVTDINYTAFAIITKHFALNAKIQNAAYPEWTTDIIQINSKSGLEGSNKNGSYAGGKFGGIGLVQSFAMELVVYGIKVNAICPGNFFDGPLWSDPEKGLFVQYLNAGKVPGAKNIADVKSFYEAKVPMNRGCYGIDVLRAIFYIVEQEYETGQAVPVTGGQVMLK